MPPRIPLPSGPLVIAHRGGSWPGIPGEQTVAHFERAVDIGVDYIEVDLWETSDGKIVCHHDADCAGRTISQTPYARLREAAEAAGIEPPTLLSELLAVTAGRCGLDLEIKAGGFEERLAEQVRREGNSQAVIYKSFEDAVVRRMKEVAPEVASGLLLGTGSPRFGPLSRVPELFPEWRLRQSGADFVSPHFRLLRLGFLRRVRRLGYPVLVWTVNEASGMEALRGKVRGVITDFPAMAQWSFHHGSGIGSNDTVSSSAPEVSTKRANKERRST